jgi:POT family proton-dependent oligopeptide transporter
MWFLADAAGQAINSQIVKFYTPENEINYFLIVGVCAIIAGVILAFLVKPVKRLMEGVN